MVGLGQSFKELEGNDMGRVLELFMGKYFLASAQHAKSREFLELKQGTMIVLEYVISSLNKPISVMIMWPRT